MQGQIDIFHYLLGLEADEEISPAQEYYLETMKTTYWQDSQGKPYKWWKWRDDMTMWVWEKGYENELLCDTCIYNEPVTQCCGADDCFGGDHYENQNTLFPEDEREDS